MEMNGGGFPTFLSPNISKGEKSKIKVELFVKLNRELYLKGKKIEITEINNQIKVKFSSASTFERKITSITYSSLKR